MDGSTSADLIRAARERGHRVTPSQLERWRYEGLIPAARQRGRGKGAGALWLHPPPAIEQLFTILAIRRPREPLAELAVRLWLRKYDVPLAMLRKHLTRRLAVVGGFRRRVRQLGTVGVGESFAELLRRSPSKRAEYGIETFGREGYEKAQQIGEAVAATFDPRALPASKDRAATIVGAMNFSAAESSIIGDLGVDLREEIAEAMPMVAAGDQAVAEADTEEVLEARELWTRVHAIDETARALSPNHPLRDFLLRLTRSHDGSIGFAMLLLAMRRARDAGISDPLERFDVAFGLRRDNGDSGT